MLGVFGYFIHLVSIVFHTKREIQLEVMRCRSIEIGAGLLIAFGLEVTIG